MNKLVLIVVALGLSLSVQFGCDEPEDADGAAEAPEAVAEPADNEPAEEDGAEQAQEQAAADEEQDEPNSEFDYPGFDLDELTGDQRGALARLAESELCPCEDSVESLHACMQDEERCEEADEMAQTLVGAATAESEQDAVEQVARDRAERGGGQEFLLEGSPYKGSLDADVIIVEFADFQCPHCRTAAAALDEVAEAYGDDIAVVFKNFPLGSPVAEQAHRAAMAAHEQGRFWEMQRMIFDNQRQIDRGELEGFARRLGINYDRFQADMESEEIQSAIMRDRQEGIEAGVSGTPAIFINGERHTGGLSPDAFSQRIDEELN